jgi:Cytochrome C oxidase, cbb3-type, subunit III
MNRGCRTLRSLTSRPALYPTIAGALLLAMTACSDDRRSRAGSTDSSTATTDTTAMASDTGRVPDTAALARTDTGTAQRDTAQGTAARQAPAAKPAPKPAPKPRVAQAPKADMAKAPSAPADTSASAGRNTESAPLRDPYHTAPLDTVSQQVYNGWKQYNLNCARCHGEDVQGTTIAPHLLVSLRPDGTINTKELFMQTVCAGRPAKGMPSWCALGMDMPTIESIYSYVKGRSDAKIHSGRPAVKPGG